jgi:hypothetical protein
MIVPLIIEDKKEMVTETVSEDENGNKTVSKAFAKEGLAYAMARINVRYSVWPINAASSALKRAIGKTMGR